MKAIDLIREMVYDSDLASGGVVYEYLDAFHTCTTWARRLFGGYVESGELRDGNYFCIYEDSTDASRLGKPDVVINAGDAGKVLLWRVEE